MADEELKVPSRSKADAAHAFIKAGLSTIPIVGGPTVELFQYVIQPQLDKRRETWMNKVGEKLKELEEKGLKIEDLQDNEQFASAVMHASHIALNTHHEEKLNALRNAIVKIAEGQAPEEALQYMFFNFVGSLTELHLRILKFFQSPTRPPDFGSRHHPYSLSNLLEDNIPELRMRQHIYDPFWRDLYIRGLVNTDDLHATIDMKAPRNTEFLLRTRFVDGLLNFKYADGGVIPLKCTTHLGDEFLSFISEA